MASSIEFFDAVKVKHHLPSDYALANALGVSRQTISQYRHGRIKGMDAATAVKVADLLEMDPMLIIAVAERERAHGAGERELWEKLVRKLGGLAACLVAGIGLAGAPAPAEARFDINQVGELQNTHMRIIHKAQFR